MMDKAWVHLKRNTIEYREAVRQFVKLAILNTGEEKLRCPCIKCQNFRRGSAETVEEHLVISGMDLTYTTWIHHGEPLDSAKSSMETTETFELCKAAYVQNDVFPEATDERREVEFNEFVENAELPLYPDCTKYTKLAATVVLYKLKVMYGMSGKCFNGVLEAFCDMLPPGNTLPNSSYSAESLIKEFQLEEKQIHACVNDCCLFRNELEESNSCPKCKSSRWKDIPQTKKKKKVPAKVLRYFLIIPRLKRMFQLPKLAEQLRWHHNNKSEDGNMRHPVDSEAWDVINKKWPSFSAEPRNLRLGLSTDGINPYRNLSSTHSCWPVMLVTYNLPPWMCMRKEHLMLALLILGPKQPGNDIDIYLQPLVDDLKELWNIGVEVYDAFTNNMFNLRVILMWTVSDFPAYGNLAGCTVKGRAACPICGVNTRSIWLPFSRKTVYMHHRCFLSPNHSFRKKKKWFNGKREKREKPDPLTGSKIYNEIKNFKNDWGKGGPCGKKRKRDDTIRMWKKKSIFFDLPYWEHLLLRHNLDVMHIEKNVCESIIGTLLNVKWKTKDGLEARKDLIHMKIRDELHPEPRGNRFYLPPAPHTLSKEEKKIFCERLEDLKLPYGYSSNIRKHATKDEFKISNLKSHDFHVLMQQLLPVLLRGLLPNGPRNAIFRLCAFFNELCQKVINIERLEELEKDVVETLCMFERFFPPSFFDIMVHLTIHLGQQARLGGPVHPRWMYTFERYMQILKGYVKNRARPEGCIAKCYLADECMKFCSEFIKQAAEIDNRSSRNQDFANDVILDGRPISGGVSFTLTDERLHSAHRYVLFNTTEIEPYLEMHLEELRNQSKHLSTNNSLLWKKHADEFSTWLYDKIVVQDSNDISETLKWLAYGPRKQAMSYSAYIVNGQRFQRKNAEKSTQNSGVSLEATTMCRSSSKDKNQIMEKVSYYGVIQDIILLDYRGFQVSLFYCNWANIGNGVKIEDGFTLVNLHQGQQQFENDPFILASQAKQVFYSRENKKSNWYVVLKAPPRGFHGLDVYDEIVDSFSGPLDASRLDKSVDKEDGSYVRQDCDGMLV